MKIILPIVGINGLHENDFVLAAKIDKMLFTCLFIIEISADTVFDWSCTVHSRDIIDVETTGRKLIRLHSEVEFIVKPREGKDDKAFRVTHKKRFFYRAIPLQGHAFYF